MSNPQVPNPLDMRNVSAFIFDLDGVVWRGDSPVSGAPEAITQLKAAGKTCLYCTNNASKKPSDYVEKLAAMGVEAHEDEIMTSAVATAIYLSSQLTGQFSAYVVGEDGLVSALQKMGARVVTMSGLSDVGDFVVENTAFPVDCVIVGIDRHFSYEKICLAQNFILNGARFIATNRDATFPVAEGVVPGAGAMVSAIETACGTSPLTVGKPQALMPILLMQKFNLDKATTVFVGDRLETDMVAAHRAEIKAICVESGVATRQQAERAKGQQKPDAIYRDVAEMCAAVLEGASHVSAAPLDNALPSLSTSDAAPTQSAPTQSAPTQSAPASPSAPSEIDDVFSVNGGMNGNGSQTPPLATSTDVATPKDYSFANVDEESPSDVEVDPSPAAYAFSLDDAAPIGGTETESTPRLAPHLAAPGLSPSSAATTSADAKSIASPEASSAENAPVTPGVNTANASNVDEPLDNWWESIEDAFKKK